MELKHKLEKIFNSDYPGTDRFIADVIEPIFGNEIEYINDDLAEREQYAGKAKKAGIKHIKYIGDLTEKNYNAQNIALLDVTLDDSKDIERSRVNIQQLIRSIMDYRQHLMIVFHYEDVTNKQWRFSYAYKGNSLKDSTSAKRYTYVFGRGYRGRTAAERFQILADSSRNDEDFEKAFSVQALSDDFFNSYREIYADFVDFITGMRYEKVKGKYVEVRKHEPDPQFVSTFDGDPKRVRDYIKKMFGRIVFLYFLQRKGWLYNDDGVANPHYMHDLFVNSSCKNDFLDGCLEHLFFYVLNTKESERSAQAYALPGGRIIPYLNGGLFERDDIDPLTCVFPADYFKRLFDFLDRYNFTIDENDQEDAEVGIDPEMLGRIFENLLEDNKDKGAFYTPKEIVDYMCRESIIAYLQNGASTDEGKELIRKYIETLDIDLLNERQRDYLEDKLIKVKICDPAIGSGAFPMGLVNLLSKIFISLRTYSTINQARMKRYIMQQSIYGVDIEQGAVDIARLRFWLAMVVDEDKPTPLPNLHFKIMHGNSLLESYKGLDLKALMERDPSRIDFLTDQERDQLQADLRLFYAESDHTKRDQLMTRIKQTVIRMIHNADENISFEGLDVSSNNDFFLWHTWFSDVFANGGFDIVIGNPPYIDSETMTNTMPKLRKEYKRLYSTAQGNWDIFIIFIELGISLLKENGVFAYIIPNKIIAAKYAEACRKFIQDRNLRVVRDYGSVPVFEAAVYPCVVILENNAKRSEKVFQSMDSFSTILRTSNVANEFIELDTLWDKYFIDSNKLSIILKITDNPKMGALNVRIKGAATVNEAYQIKEVILEKEESSQSYFRFINTGTIDKYESLWGIKPTQYIKGRYIEPVVNVCDLEKINHTRVDQASSPKIIVAGMSSTIEALYDEGNILAGKSTSIICGDVPVLKYILTIINSKLIDFWLNINFNSLKMAGGYINVGVNELNSLPIRMDNFYFDRLQSLCDNMMANPKDSISMNQIDHTVYHLYCLTYDEVLIIDPETPISREEYDNPNFK